MYPSLGSQNYSHVLIETNLLNQIAMSTHQAVLPASRLAESIVPFAPIGSVYKPPFSFQPMAQPGGPVFGQQSMGYPCPPAGPVPTYGSGPSFADKQTQRDTYRQPTGPAPAFVPESQSGGLAPDGGPASQPGEFKTPGWSKPGRNPFAATDHLSQLSVPAAPEGRTLYESGEPGVNQESQSVNTSDPATSAFNAGLDLFQKESIEKAAINLSVYTGTLYFSSQGNINVSKLIALSWLFGMLVAVKRNNQLFASYKAEIIQAAQNDFTDAYFTAICARTNVLTRVSFDMCNT